MWRHITSKEVQHNRATYSIRLSRVTSCQGSRHYRCRHMPSPPLSIWHPEGQSGPAHVHDGAARLRASVGSEVQCQASQAVAYLPMSVTASCPVDRDFGRIQPESPTPSRYRARPAGTSRFVRLARAAWRWASQGPTRMMVRAPPRLGPRRGFCCWAATDSRARPVLRSLRAERPPPTT